MNAARSQTEAEVIGIDLGGTCIKAILASQEGVLKRSLTVSFDPDVPLDFAHAIRRITEQFGLDKAGGQMRVGISAPGLASADGDSIAFMPGRLSGLEGLKWGPFLGYPSVVPVLNDAHAALLGEIWLGAAKGLRNVIMLTLGTGVGGAAVVDGNLLRGRIGRAGHLGHVCLDPLGPKDVTGMPGALEMAIGNCSIQERTGGRFSTTHQLVAAYLSGDGEAGEVWLRSVRALACAIASFVNVLDCEAAVIGGGIAKAGDALFIPLRAYLKEIEWTPGGVQTQILPAELGEMAGAYGAAFNALHR